MTYYDHATLMALRLDRWDEDRFLPHPQQDHRLRQHIIRWIRARAPRTRVNMVCKPAAEAADPA